MPNIFEYATSELSQDAMIAWLMACAKADEDDAALREVGRSFIRFLLERPCNNMKGAVIDGDDQPQSYGGDGVVSVIKEVETQYRHVDVYCRVKIDNKLVSFVIEDKTGTTQHSGQLERYRKLAQSDKRHEDYVKLIYLKTGMPFPDELDAAAKAHFCHVGVKDLKCFLNSEPAIAASSDLLQQYRTHIAELAAEQETAKQDWDMDWGPIQREFAEKLKDATRNANDCWAPHDGEPDVIWRSRNRGGGHWTQYRFFGGHLFWRTDSGRSDLRMMVEREKVKSINVDVHQYRIAFEEACKREGQPWKRTRLFAKSREASLGAIPYPCGRKIGQNVDAFLDSIAQVHERFLRELAQLRADNATS